MKYRLWQSKSSNVKQWIHDNELLIDAAHAVNRDETFHAEVKQLEKKYLKKHLAEIAGDEQAERIIAERGL